MRTLLPLILSALLPGLGQIYLRDFLKGVFMFAIPITFGIIIDLIPFVYLYLLSLIWSLTDLYLITERKETKEKAIKSLIFAILIVIIIIPTLFYLFMVSMKTGGNYVASEFLNTDRTKEEMLQIANALDKYNSYYKKYPANFNEFINSKPIWSDWQSDSWKNEYKYIINADSTKYLLISAGKDQIFDTADDLLQEN